MPRKKMAVVLVPENEANDTECESDGEEEGQIKGFHQEDSDDDREEYMEWKEGDMNFSTLRKSIVTELQTQDLSSLKKLNNATPFDLFSLFFDDQMIDMIRSESKRYAEQNQHNFQVSRSEMQVFLGILLVTGYSQASQEKMYWSKQKDCRNEAITKAMSRDRFMDIKRYLHFVNNEEGDTADKFYKIRPVIDFLNEKFMFYAPFDIKTFDVDESMIPYFGRHPSKQCMRAKPVRFGFKIFCLNLSTGYLLQFKPYQGKHGNDKYTEYGLGGSIVLSLLDSLKPRNIKGIVYLDNFFSSPALFRKLTTIGFGVVGTFRRNRIEKIPFKQDMKKEVRGASQSFSQENGSGDSLVLCKVKDNNEVIIGSNFKMSSEKKTMMRYSKNEKKRIAIEFPSLLEDYNKHMGGTDMMDQQISAYRIGIKKKKFYFSIFSWCLTSTVFNAWCLYKKLGHEIPLIAFIRLLTAKLLSFSERPSLGRSMCRFNSLHISVYHEKRRRCVHCKKRTNFYCSGCSSGADLIFLCAKYCAINYHKNLH